MINKVFDRLFSNMGSEWIDVDEILNFLMDQGLSLNEAELVLDFLSKYFLEFDSSGRKVRVLSCFRRLYEES